MLGVSFEDLTHRVDRVVGDNTGHGVFLFFVDLVQEGFDDLGADQRGEHVDVGLLQTDFVEDCFGCFSAVFVEEFGDVDDIGFLVFFVVDQDPVTDEFVGVIQGQTPGGWQSVGRSMSPSSMSCLRLMVKSCIPSAAPIRIASESF